MQETLSLIGLFLSIIVSFQIVKGEKFSPLRAYLNKLFWVDLIDEKAKDLFPKRFLLLGAKFFMYSYIFVVPLFLFQSISQIAALPGSLLLIVAYPLMYRVTMGFQRLIWRIK